jgi:hypothetical protein
MRKISGQFGVLIGIATLIPMMLAASVPVWGQNNPVPEINDPLVPGVAVPGGSGLTLTVNGTGFAHGASVNWNGTPLITVMVSSGKLTATVPAADIATPGTAYVTVTNPGAAQASNAAPFFITNPVSSVAFVGSNVVSLSGQNLLGVADFNGDGNLDIALDDAEGNIDVLLGHGDGTFSTPVVTPANQSFVSGAVIADFNGDGKLDIATPYIAVYFGNGDGTFTAGPQNPPFEGGYYDPAGADFNRDGQLDLALPFCFEGCEDEVLLGQGGGVFQTGSFFNSGGGGTGTPQVGDFNRDGFLDVATTDTYTGLLGVFLGNGDGSFQNGVDYGSGTLFANAVVTADFNGDGILDLATTTSYSVSDIYVWLGNGDGTFGTGVPYATGYPSNLFVGDFNGDGKPDLMAAAYDSTLGVDTVSLLLGNGDGTFQNHVDYVVGANAIIEATGDFNNDGKLDFVTVAGSGFVSVFLQSIAQLSIQDLTFGDQLVGTTSPAQPVTLTNIGSTALAIGSISVTGANPGDFAQRNNCGTSLSAGTSCTINVTFTPTANGVRGASLSIADGAAGSPQTVSLTGTGTQPAVKLSPTSLTFGVVVLHAASATKPVMLTNSGTGTLYLIHLAVAGDFSQTNNCGSSVAAGASCTVNVTFKPTQPGTRNGTLSIADNAPGSPQTVTLAGTGTEVKLPGQSINFGDQQVGTTGPPVPVTLSNVGSTTLDIFGIRIEGADPGDFVETNNCGNSVAPGASCTITLTFAPTSIGLRTAGLVVYDNGGASPQGIGLSGTGTQ